MLTDRDRSPAEWFEEAARCYVAGHQACAWCGGSHRVFRADHRDRLEYYCNACEFYVCHDRRKDDYFAAPGQAAPAETATAC